MKVLSVAIIAFCVFLASFVILEKGNQGDVKREGKSELQINEEKSIISRSALPYTDEAVEDGPKNAPNSPDPISPFPKPALPLRLLALFQTYDQSQATAVILHPDIGAYRYHVGEEIDRGRILAAILPDRILVREGRDITVLHLEPLSVMPGESTEENSDDVIANIPLSEAEQKKQNILKHFDLYPVSDSTASGYIIGDKFPEDAAKSTGVKPGDVLISVNGYPVGEENSDYLAWISFQTTQKASVVVSRDGKEFVIYYPDDVMQPGGGEG